MDTLDRALKEFMGDLSRLHEGARRSIWLHLTKPWVSEFRSVVISPLKPKLDDYLAREIDGLRGVEDSPWYFPSLRWWRSHVDRSHGPDGLGCDVRIHTAFLSADAADPEFLYANVLWTDKLEILVREDFEDECRWWNRNAKKVVEV